MDLSGHKPRGRRDPGRPTKRWADQWTSEQAMMSKPKKSEEEEEETTREPSNLDKFSLVQ
jgi:hypothetical protein